MAEPLREPGWYRLTEAGWEPVDVTTAAMAGPPLF